jgi:hypothetical protein
MTPAEVRSMAVPEYMAFLEFMRAYFREVERQQRRAKK